LVKLIGALIIGYIIGASPFGYWVGRIFGKIDVRQYGSGNIGATNVARCMGIGWGVLVFALDVGKGVGAVLVGQAFGGTAGALLGGIGAILGHSFTFWLGFKGGKGVATGLGVFGALLGKAVGLAFIVWLIVFLLTRYVSLASISAAIALPFFAYLIGYRGALLYASIAAALLIVARHHTNIKRLLRGEEKKFSFKKAGR